MKGPMSLPNSIAEKLCQIYRQQAEATNKLNFYEPVAYVYNPLSYGQAAFEDYLRRYANGPKKAILLGMNPGPFGMVQTAVPFGDVGMVTQFLGITGGIDAPEDTHPKRPIDGFACPRREVSGQRLWGWISERYGSASRFFAKRLVLNYCPLAFLEASGSNRTPDRLAASERQALEAICDDTLRQVLALTEARYVIGIGKWATQRAVKATESMPNPPQIASILHPSPASPKANRGWQQYVEAEIQEKSLQRIFA